MKIFNKSFSSRKATRRLLMTGLACLLSMPVASAHQHEGHDKAAKHAKAELKKNKSKKDSKYDEKEEMTKEEVMREISYLAKKLLDQSNQDTITVKSPAVVKPFIGVCSKILDQGVELTCITPESQAEKNGLKTGDIVQSINGISLVGSDPKARQHPYWPVVNKMKTGDLLKMKVLRGGQALDVDVTVGSLTHPAYELTVTR